MIIGVDRLDYTKGIPERMDAFERFLGNFPDWRGKVTYLQITPRSRTGIPEYADISRKVGEAVGRINGAYRRGVVDAAALHQQGAQPHRARRPLPRRARGAGDAVARRHEPGGQGIRRGAGRRGSRRADPVALCRRRARIAPPRCWSILTIRKASPSPSTARWRCRSPSGASGTRHNFTALAANDLSHWAERFLATLEKQAAPRMSGRWRAPRRLIFPSERSAWDARRARLYDRATGNLARPP